MHKDPNLDLVNFDVYTKFWLNILSIYSQDIE